MSWHSAMAGESAKGREYALSCWCLGSVLNGIEMRVCFLLIFVRSSHFHLDCIMSLSDGLAHLPCTFLVVSLLSNCNMSSSSYSTASYFLCDLEHVEQLDIFRLLFEGCCMSPRSCRSALRDFTCPSVRAPINLPKFFLSLLTRI